MSPVSSGVAFCNHVSRDVGDIPLTLSSSFTRHFPGTTNLPRLRDPNVNRVAWDRVLFGWTARGVEVNVPEERKRVTARGERRWEPFQQSFDELRTMRT